MFAESKYLSWLIFHICVCWKSVFAFDEYQYLIGFAWIARTINQNYPSPGWQCRCLPSEISSTLKSFCFSLTKISTWISSKTLNLKIDTPCSNSAFERFYSNILIIKKWASRHNTFSHYSSFQFFAIFTSQRKCAGVGVCRALGHISNSLHPQYSKAKFHLPPLSLHPMLLGMFAINTTALRSTPLSLESGPKHTLCLLV